MSQQNKSQDNKKQSTKDDTMINAEQFKNLKDENQEEDNQLDTFLQKMYSVCFKQVIQPNKQIGKNEEVQLQNCFNRFIQSYRLVGDIIHKNEVTDEEEDYEDEYEEDYDDNQQEIKQNKDQKNSKH